MNRIKWKEMEQLNEVELIGIVGSVSSTLVRDEKSTRFAVATNYAYRDRGGMPVIETTWHAVRAFEGDNMRGLEKLSRGDRVRIVGRLRNCRYTDSAGNDRTVTEVYATSLEILDEALLESQCG